MSLAHITPREQVAHFLEHSEWKSLAVTDLHTAPGTRVTATVRIVLAAPWTALTGSAQALVVLDRELRRAATAWEASSSPWLDGEGGTWPDEGPFTEDHVIDPLARLLREHPEPKRSAGELRVIATEPDPFTLLLEPTGSLHTLLSELPTSTLLYAMAGFGQDMRVQHYWHVEPMLGVGRGGSRELDILREARDGRWPGRGPEGAHRTERISGRPSRFRAVAPPHEARGLPCAMVYAETMLGEGTMAVIELLPSATPVFDLVRARHTPLL